RYIDKMAWVDTRKRLTKSGKEMAEKNALKEIVTSSLNVIKSLSSGRGQKYNNNINEVIKNDNHLFEEFLNITRLNLVSGVVLELSSEFKKNFDKIDDDYKELYYPEYRMSSYRLRC